MIPGDPCGTPSSIGTFQGRVFGCYGGIWKLNTGDTGSVCGISVAGIAYGYCKGVAFIYPTQPTCPSGYYFGNWADFGGGKIFSSCFKVGYDGSSITLPF